VSIEKGASNATKVKQYLLALILCVLSFTVLANEPISYKGLSWSTTPSQLKQKYPSFYCKQAGRETLCISNSETYFAKTAESYLRFIDGTLKWVEIRIEFTKENSLLDDPKLYSMAFFVDLKTELIKKYGEPDAPTENHKLFKVDMTKVASWKRKDASLNTLVIPKERSSAGEYVVQVMFSTSDYGKLSTEITQVRKSKDL
jgi:hypothetical protein